MDRPNQGQLPVLQRLLEAMNAHDLDAMVACFADDYVNETPAHPQRGFRGSAQVRTNWTQILAGVPNLRARVPRSAVDGGTLWTEWDITGTRPDGTAFLMRGVVIFGITDQAITSARFYLEPVEETSGDVDAHTRRVVGTAANPKEIS
ncbi:nuclear transport factor 2 family protein [Kribbella sp. VKM Ac-2566]|uniref:nuclear transport factor 2 family protein n=1 Tax=Kribbella sp. VKM Ac-2566 TaxID=2512218 RepID=UPI0010637148|nr:nuclear transport factor 2 family protein [Kribbella sp. VKM Ac-2566]TDW83484.1 ketosteroid isomerase-like protein [Kribbella sp. VKM Ac-2566]